jgi:hypothetical protein
MQAKQKLSIVKNSPARAISQADKPTSILDQRFRYQGSVETDLRARFKAMGFKTPKPKKPQFGK